MTGEERAWGTSSSWRAIAPEQRTPRHLTRPLPQPHRVVTPSPSRKMSRAGLESSVFVTPPPTPSSLLARELINIPLWLGRPSPAPTRLLHLLPGSVPGPATSMPPSSALGSLCSSSWLQGPWILSLGGGERVSRSQPGREVLFQHCQPL